MSKFTQKQKKRLEEIAGKTAHIMPFAGDTPQAKAMRIEMASRENWDGFSYFCVTYFPNIFTRPFCSIHQTMFEETEAACGVIGITGFRALGKTVLMGIAYSIWKIMLGERYVIFLAADIEQAQEKTEFILNELNNNKRLLADYPDMKPVDEDTKNFYLKNKTRIRAKSIKTTIRGTINPKTARRPGLINCDDIDKEENQGNQKIGGRKMDKIRQEVRGLLDPQKPGRVLWLGNLVHPNYAICQYKELLKNEILGGINDFNAEDAKGQKELDSCLRRNDGSEPVTLESLEQLTILRAPNKILMRFSLEKPDGTSAWEEQYPTANLPAIRSEYGNTGYQREMLGRPVIEGNIFKSEWFTIYKQLPEPSKIKRVWMYADPAWGDKGCFKSVTAIAYDGYKFYMTHVWLRQTQNTKFFRYFYDTYQELDRTYKYKFRAAMDTTFGQQRMLDDFDQWCRANGLPPISHHIKHIDLKEDKNMRIERTETIIETAKLVFPEGQDTATLISQYGSYPDGYIDGPDGVAGNLERFCEYDIGKNRVRVRRIRY